MAKLIHADPSASCSFGGVAFSPGDDGLIEVPDEAVGALAAFGFTLAPEPAPTSEPAPKKSKKKE